MANELQLVTNVRQDEVGRLVTQRYNEKTDEPRFTANVTQFGDLLLQRATLQVNSDGSVAWVYYPSKGLWSETKNVGATMYGELVWNVLQPLSEDDPSGSLARIAKQTAEHMTRQLLANEEYREGYFNDPLDQRFDYIGTCAYFQNGKMNIKGELLSYEPTDYRTRKTILPINVQETPVTQQQIENNIWYQFMKWLFDDGSDMAMMEYIGSAFFERKFGEVTLAHLTASRSVKDGNNGKTTLAMDFLARLFGTLIGSRDGQRAFMDDDQFGSADDAGLLITYLDEVNTRKWNMETVKTRVTAKTTYVNPKGKARFETRATTHYLTSANGGFEINDPSEGSMRRVILLVIKRHMRSGSQDRIEYEQWFDKLRNGLFDEHAAEFARWCLQCFANVLERGRNEQFEGDTPWTQSAEATELRDQLAISRTPTQAILNGERVFKRGKNTDLLPLPLVKKLVQMVAKWEDERDVPRPKDITQALREHMYREGKKSKTPPECTNTHQNKEMPLQLVQGFYLSGDGLTRSERNELCAVLGDYFSMSDAEASQIVLMKRETTERDNIF